MIQRNASFNISMYKCKCMNDTIKKSMLPFGSKVSFTRVIMLP